jgi:hypothetical protein
MKRKIDLGEDKNAFSAQKTGVDKQPTLSFLNDDLPKSADDTMTEARSAVWYHWLNSEPLLIGHVDEAGKAYLFPISDLIKGKVILFDFWDFTLLPSRRSLSYVLEWHRRYASAGLIVIGVHSPVFEFGKDRKNIEVAVRGLGITYPVVMDSNFEIWRAFENRFWPRRILMDSQNRIQKDDVGEIGYAEMEKTIQVLLRELSPGLACPPVLKPMRAVDQPDFEVPSVTEEIFLGVKRRPRLGNAQSFTGPNEEVHFKDESHGSYAPESPYLDGLWLSTKESIVGTAYKEKGSNSIAVRFQGSDAYIVAGPRAKNIMDVAQTAKATVLINGAPIPTEHLGRDLVINEFRRSILTVRDPGIYHLAGRLNDKAHDLKIILEPEGTDTMELYALFFEYND